MQAISGMQGATQASGAQHAAFRSGAPQSAADQSSPAPQVPAQRSAQRIDRRSGLTARELHYEYAVPERPVILTDAVAHWPAMEKFSWDFFRERYGHIAKEVRGKRYTLREVIDWIFDPQREEPAPYPFNLNIETCFPELMRDIQPEVSFGLLDRINHPLLPRVLLKGTEPYELFFGGRGGWFPRVHYDALCMNTQITQVRGSKEFYLYPPEQGAYMYAHPDNEKLSLVDFNSPDYEKFPLFRNAMPIVETVREGETIFFPKGWWHATRIHEPCISMGRTQLNGVNWDAYCADVSKFWWRFHPRVAWGIDPYLRVAGRIMDAQERRLERRAGSATTHGAISGQA